MKTTLGFTGIIELLIFIGTLVCLVPLLGRYMYDVFSGRKTWIHLFFGRLENLCYNLCGINPKIEMRWKEYAKALFCFNFFGFLVLIAIQLLQGYLPLNPQKFGSDDLPSVFNTAMSFVTNTNWQSYAGETQMSYFTQMVGLTTQNFLSAATSLVALVAMTRGIIGRMVSTIGNFWVDLIRSVIYVFLPTSIILALLLVSQGVIQNFSPYLQVPMLEESAQIIPMGPAASQIAIKQLGTNGAGFFNTNSAHPFENPNGITNFLEMLAILLIPAASIYMYGIFIKSKKDMILLLSVMIILVTIGFAIALASENAPNPIFDAAPLLEGKETRFGVQGSVLWSILTTATSNGSVNSSISSLSPMAGGVALFNIVLEELVFGGVGVGLCRMLMFTLLTVFLSSLMVGRTPEYLGKKIEKTEIQWIIAAILFPTIIVLSGTGLSVLLPHATDSIKNSGPHGLTEILYAFASATENNGSAFASLNSDTDYYNIALGICMFLGRFSIILPSLAISGSLAKKNISPASPGTFATDTFLFGVLLFSIIVIVGALSYFPVISLGPIIEQFLMRQGRVF